MNERVIMWQSWVSSFLVSVLLAGCVAPAAQEPSLPQVYESTAIPPKIEIPAKLDEGTAIRIALQSDPRLGSWNAAVDVARAQRGAAWEMRDPQLRFDYEEVERTSLPGGMRMIEQYEQYQYALRLYPPNPFVASARKSGGDASISAAAAELAVAERGIAVEVMRLFARISYLEKDIGLLSRLARLNLDRKTFFKEKSAAGEATTGESLSAGLDYLEAASARDTRRRELDLMRAQLGHRLGGAALDNVNLIEPDQRQDVNADQLDEQELISLAMANRQLLTAAEAEVRSAQAGLSEIKRGRWPWFAHIQGGISDEQRDEGNESWFVQAAFEVPVFSWFDGEEDVRSAQAAEMEARLEGLRSEIRIQVVDALGSLRRAQADLNRFHEETGGITQEMESLLKDVRSEEGVDPELTFDLEKSLVEAQRESLRCNFECQQAVIGLQEATGTDLSGSVR
ncbi:MAG: TolC family protein [Verrucomicrobia bacterium]|nr:TolC family protein [Verrucomicrobiota bacterium]